jgi:hypothetical protein
VIVDVTSTVMTPLLTAGFPRSRVAIGVAVPGLAPAAKISRTYRLTAVAWLLDALKATRYEDVALPLTVMLRDDDVAVAPSLSVARADSEYVPAATPLQLIENGDEVSDPIGMAPW